VSKFVIALSFAAALTVLTPCLVHEQECTLRGHSEGVLSVAYSPDGKHIVSGSEDCTVKVWDSQTGKEVNVLVCHHLSIAACTDADIRVWSMSRSAR